MNDYACRSKTRQGNFSRSAVGNRMDGGRGVMVWGLSVAWEHKQMGEFSATADPRIQIERTPCLDLESGAASCLRLAVGFRAWNLLSQLAIFDVHYQRLRPQNNFVP